MTTLLRTLTLLIFVLLPFLARAGELVGTVPGKFRTQAQACGEDIRDPDTFATLVAIYTVRNAQVTGDMLTFHIDEAPQLPLQARLVDDPDLRTRLTSHLHDSTAFVLFTRPGQGDPTDPERPALTGAVLDYTVMISNPQPWGEECNYVSQTSTVMEADAASLPPTLKSMITGFSAADKCGAAFIAGQFEPGAQFFRMTGMDYANKVFNFQLDTLPINYQVRLTEDVDYLVDGSLKNKVKQGHVLTRLSSPQPPGSAGYDLDITLYAMLDPTKSWTCTQLGVVSFTNLPASNLPRQMTGQ